MLISGSEDKTVKLWDYSGGGDGSKQHLVRTFEGHSRAVTSVAFSPDAKLVISGSRDADIRVWETFTKKDTPLRVISAHAGAVNAVAFDQFGFLVVSASDDATIKVWDAIDGGRALLTIAHGGETSTEKVNSVAFSADGMRIISGGINGSFKTWELPSGKLLSTASHAHSDAAEYVSVKPSPDNHFFATCSHDGSGVELVTLTTGGRTSTERDATKDRRKSTVNKQRRVSAAVGVDDVTGKALNLSADSKKNAREEALDVERDPTGAAFINVWSFATADNEWDMVKTLEGHKGESLQSPLVPRELI